MERAKPARVPATSVQRKGDAEAPTIYRGLFQAGYKGLVKSGISKPKVLLGEAQPTVKDYPPASKLGELYDAVSPIALLRGALCLNAKYKKAPTCEPLPAYGFSIHPYTTPAGPYYKPPNSEDVTIGTLGRMVAAQQGCQIRGDQSQSAALHHRVRDQDQARTEQQRRLRIGAGRMGRDQRTPGVGKLARGQLLQYLLKDSVLGRGATDRPGEDRRQKEALLLRLPGSADRDQHPRRIQPLGLRAAGQKSDDRDRADPEAALQIMAGAEKVKTGGLGYWTLKSPVNASYWSVRWVSPSGAKYEGPPIKASDPPGRQEIGARPRPMRRARTLRSLALGARVALGIAVPAASAQANPHRLSLPADRPGRRAGHAGQRRADSRGQPLHGPG